MAIDFTQSELTLAELYTITPVYSIGIARFTSYNKDISYGGFTYQAVPIKRGAIKYHTDLTIDKVEINLGLSGLLIGDNSISIIQAIRRDYLRSAQVKIETVDYVALDFTKLLFEGWITGAIGYDAGVVTFQVGSILDKLQDKFPKIVYTNSCNHHLFDKYCGLVKADYVQHGIVDPVSTQSHIISPVFAYSNKPAGYWTKGEIKIINGLNAGISRSILQHSDGNVDLLTSFPEDVHFNSNGRISLENHSALFPSIGNTGDIRFTASDAVTLLDSHIVNVSGNAPGRIVDAKVKVLANLDTNQDIYLYYGNSSAVNDDDPNIDYFFYENWESGSIDPSVWTQGGTGFSILSSEYLGGKSAICNNAPYGSYGNYTGSIQTTVNCPVDAVLSFVYKNTNNSGTVTLWIDGSWVWGTSSWTDWTEKSFPLSAGTHTIKFQYGFDASGVSNAGGFDEIKIPRNVISNPPTVLSNDAEESSLIQPWLTGWSYRKKITIQGSQGAGSDYVVPITLIESSDIGFDVYPGCDLSGKTCDEKFNNYVDFLGFEYIPKPDTIL